VVFEGFGSDSFLGDEFYGRAEEVMKESTFLGVKGIEEGDGVGVVDTLVAEPLADMGPVFLFDVGVIVFVVSSAAGKFYGYFSSGEMAEQVVV